MSPLGGAIVALILVVVIGGVGGWVLLLIGSAIGALLAWLDFDLGAIVSLAVGWVGGILVWVAAFILAIMAVIRLVQVLT